MLNNVKLYDINIFCIRLNLFRWITIRDVNSPLYLIFPEHFFKLEKLEGAKKCSFVIIVKPG